MPPTPQVNSVWANNTPQAATEMFTCPSGQIVEARRIGMEGLIAAGILAEADSLTSLVTAGPIEDGKKRMAGHKAKQSVNDDQTMIKKLMKDPNALTSLLTLADKAIPHIVVNPPVHIHHTNTGDKSQRLLTAIERAQIVKDNPGTVFVDQIDMLDKMELFSWACGDMEALHAFRNPTTDDVGSVGAESGVSRPAKQTSRRK